MSGQLYFATRNDLLKYIRARLNKRARRLLGKILTLRDCAKEQFVSNTYVYLFKDPELTYFHRINYVNMGKVKISELKYAIRIINQMALTGEYTRDIHHVSP